MFIGVGGPVGMVLIGAASGSLVSGGASVIQQKATTGDVDWRKIGVDAAIGGVLGGASADAAVFSTSALGARAGASVSSGASRAASAVGGAALRAIGAATSVASSPAGMKIGANALVGGAGNLGNCAVTTDNFTAHGAVAAFAGGSVGGGLSSGLGGLTRNLGSGTAGFLNAGIGAGGNLIGGTTQRMMNGQEYFTADIL